MERFVDEERRFLPTQAAIASTPGRLALGDSRYDYNTRIGIVSPIRDGSLPSSKPSTPYVHGTDGGFDLYERGVDAVHSATREWRRSPKSPTPRSSPYSPAFAAGISRAASAPPVGRVGGTLRGGSEGRRFEPSSLRTRDDAEAAYVARIRGARSNPRGGEPRMFGSDSIAPGPNYSRPRPAWGGGGGRVGGGVGRPGFESGRGSSARRLFDPDAKARAERAAAVAAAAERKAVERMEAARSRRNTTGSRSGGAAWQPVKRDDRSASANSANRRASSFGGGVLAPETDRAIPSYSGAESISPGVRKAASNTHTRWEESEKVEDRLRRDWVLREARREASHAERIEIERAERELERRRRHPFAVRHPTNPVSPKRAAAHGRHLHARGELRRARIEHDHATATPAQLSSPPVGMGGEESVAFRGAFIFYFRMGNSSDIVFCSQV